MSSHFLSNSFVFDHVYVESVGTTAGLLEYQGPLGSYFDKYYCFIRCCDSFPRIARIKTYLDGCQDFAFADSFRYRL